MKLHQLRSAVAVVHCDLNLTRAARALNATQPGISTHIRLLEAELGLTLFARQHKRFVGLTPAGQVILPLAAQAMKGIDVLYAAARQLSSPHSRSLVIAASPTRIHALGPVITAMRKRYPDLKLGVFSGTVTQVLAALTNGDADVCLVSESATLPSSLEFQPCYEVNWYLVVPAGHEAAHRDPLTVADIARLPLISYDESFASRAILTKAFKEAGFEANIVLSLGDCEAMQQYVIAGAGVAIVRTQPHGVLRDDCLMARRLDHLLPRSTTCIGTRRGVPVDAPMRYLVKLLRSPPGTTTPPAPQPRSRAGAVGHKEEAAHPG